MHCLATIPRMPAAAANSSGNAGISATSSGGTTASGGSGAAGGAGGGGVASGAAAGGGAAGKGDSVDGGNGGHGGTTPITITAPGVYKSSDEVWPSPVPGGGPPASTDLVDAVFTGRHKEYTNSDTWYPSWAADGDLYSNFADGNVNGVGIGSIGNNANTGRVKITGDDPLNLTFVNSHAVFGRPGRATTCAIPRAISSTTESGTPRRSCATLWAFRLRVHLHARRAGRIRLHALACHRQSRGELGEDHAHRRDPALPRDRLERLEGEARRAALRRLRQEPPVFA